MKLKTLKDLDKQWIGKKLLFTKDRLEIIAELKQEAIKDIKELSKDYRELNNKFPANFQSRETIAYIKWKFNISEKDLK